MQLNKNVYLCNQTLIQNTMSKKYTVNKNEIKAVQTLLKSIGQDVTREGLIDTPKRYVKFLKEFCTPEPFKMTTFDNEGSTNEMIIVSNIPFFSLCEHHLAPFFGTAAIAYIPNDKIVGLSKLTRLMECFAKRLQVQERLTIQVANALMESLQPKAVGVVIRCRHLCMESRGIRTPGEETVTSAMLGELQPNLAMLTEFLALARKE